MDAVRDEMRELLLAEWRDHRGRLVGTISGVLVGIAILLFGFWPIMFIALCGIAGWLIGRQHDERVDWQELLDGIMPERFAHFGHTRRRNLR